MHQRLSPLASLALLALVAYQPHAQAAPQRLKDIAADDSSGLAAEDGWSTVVGSTLLFAANDGSHGLELWRSDGTSEGTYMLRDITPGSGSSNPGGPTDVHRNAPQLGGSALFHARNGALNGGAVWKSDGSVAGTVMISSAPAGFGYATRFGDVVLFAGSASADRDLWKTDGTEAGTTQVAWLTGLRGIIDLEDGNVLLNASKGDGFRLHRSDGKSTTTYQVNATPNVVFGRGQAGLVRRSQAVYVAGGSLWGSSGTPSSTSELTFTIVGMPEAGEMFVRIQETVYFLGGSALWSTQGTGPVTQPVYSQRTLEMAAVGDTLYFVAQPLSDAELWKTAPLGTTTRVKGGFRSIRHLISFAGALYFSADDGNTGEELWTSDGTAEGTTLVADIAEEGDSRPVMLGASVSTLFFSANDGTTGRELWAYSVASPDAGTGAPDAGTGPGDAGSDAQPLDASAGDAGNAMEEPDAGAAPMEAGTEDASGSASQDSAPPTDTRDAAVVPDSDEPTEDAHVGADGESDETDGDARSDGGDTAERRSGGCALTSQQAPTRPSLMLCLVGGALLLTRRSWRRPRS